jgi:uncharacterized protein YbcI
MIASAISRRIVQLHAKLYGRGPTKAKTYLQSDYALVVLESVFTPAERTLIEAERGEHVLTTRHAFQQAVEEQFVEIVEDETGRPVRALVSQVHLATDLAVELFLFDEVAAGPSMDGSGPSDDG